MKKRSILLGLSMMLLAVFLAGCGANSELSDVSQDIQTEISEEYSTGLSEMNIKDIISIDSDEEKQLSEDFSGTIYIMATKEDLKKATATDFYLNDNEFQTVKEDSEDDFNVRYEKKTYFSVKKIEVTNLKTIKISSDWTDEIVLCLRSE